MVTDSRSFMSYHLWHQYFRRVLCNLIGTEIEKGELPDSEELVGSMISRICYQNAAEYLSLPMAEKAAATAISANGHEFARGVESLHARQVEKGS